MADLIPSPEEFRKRIADKYPAQLGVHGEVTTVLESLVSRPRYLADIVHRAVDMLFTQAFKSHVSMHELATLALVEDAATVIRRLLELCVQAIWIARDSSEDVRRRRAGMFLAFLWHKWPTDLKDRIPQAERDAWEAVLATYGNDFGADRKQWGPNFGQIFDALEESDLAAGEPKGSYRDNYAYLSNVAHGSPPSLVHTYAQPVIQLHDDRLVPQMLVFASMYSLATAMVWNDLFQLCDSSLLVKLRDKVLAILGKP
ncbi:MAG: DUF5677 domain-containing protein [Gemmatimonadales bacterium]